MIDTQALRNKILDLAMRGKLTEQLPGDGTAEELYQQVQEEKQVLIKEGKIKKEKPLPEITEEDIPFEIPNSWAWFRWGNVSFQIQYGYNAPAQDKGRIRMVRITDIQNNKVVWNTVPYCDIDEDSISEYQLYPNNILFARTGGTVGKSFLVETVEEEAVFAGYLIRTSFSSHISAKYMKYFMDSQLYWKQLRDGTTATAQPNCNAKTLSKMIVPIPPLAEQQRIVEKIDQAFSVLDIIDTLQAQYANNLTTLKAKLIDAAIQGKLTEQLPEDGTAEELYQQIQAEKEKLANKGELYREKSIKGISSEDTPYRIPKNWLWVRLGNLTKVITKGSSPKWQGVNYTDSDNGILFVTSENVGNGRMLFEKKKYVQKQFNEIHPSSILRKGDLLTNIVGASIGRTAVFNENTDSANTNQAVCIIRLIEHDCLDYILLYLCSENAIRLMLGKVVDTARANLSLTSVSNLLVPLPPLAEQRRIVERLRELSSVMTI